MTTNPKYNPNLHHRRSIRLKGYDYSSPGAYFVTICLQNRAHLFGKVENGIMILNDAGSMVDIWYRKLPSKFPEIQCREYAIMPNHFHCIIENKSSNPEKWGETRDWGRHMGLPPQGLPPQRESEGLVITPDGFDFGQFDQHMGVFDEHKGSPLSTVIQWFKTMSTNEYIRNVKTSGWPPFDRKLWQRNYYEHIVRSDDELIRIQNYIINNPIVWARDPEHQP